ncbi:hypothetical protein DSO57_1029527 [Entomophthora muscae]|uniref:Uncharacterized protein n=1 Tax=Entomophthora muscae TaxID=34485 RepID=A0ACC2SE22_9FUNG|nr:hypothetical protein DSO57_1029527 [Entomophthora muscae]
MHCVEKWCCYLEGATFLPWILADHKYGVPVHQSPKCVLGHSQGLTGRGFHSLRLKRAFIHSQKEDLLRNLLVYGSGGQGKILVCQYLESSNNILDSLYLVLDSCTLVLDFCSLNLDSFTLELNSCAALRVQLLISSSNSLILGFSSLYSSISLGIPLVSVQPSSCWQSKDFKKPLGRNSKRPRKDPVKTL